MDTWTEAMVLWKWQGLKPVMPETHSNRSNNNVWSCKRGVALVLAR